MGEDLGRAVLELATDDRKLKLGIRKGKKQAQGLSKSFDLVKTQIAGVFAGVGVAFATRALVEFRINGLQYQIS